MLSSGSSPPVARNAGRSCGDRPVEPAAATPGRAAPRRNGRPRRARRGVAETAVRRATRARSPSTSVASTTASASMLSRSVAHDVALRRAGSSPCDRGAGAQWRAGARQVVGERLPQGAVEGGPRHVEEQSFAGAEEVDVEHGARVRPRTAARVGEEAAGEHLERQVAGGVGEVERCEERPRVDVVELLVDVGDADVEEGEGRDQVDAGEVAPAEAWGCGRRRSARSTAACVGRPANPSRAPLASTSG